MKYIKELTVDELADRCKLVYDKIDKLYSSPDNASIPLVKAVNTDRIEKLTRYALKLTSRIEYLSTTKFVAKYTSCNGRVRRTVLFATDLDHAVRLAKVWCRDDTLSSILPLKEKGV